MSTDKKYVVVNPESQTNIKIEQMPNKPKKQDFIAQKNAMIVKAFSENQYQQALNITQDLTYKLEYQSLQMDKVMKSYYLYLCYYNSIFALWKLEKTQQAQAIISYALKYLQQAIDLCEIDCLKIVLMQELAEIELQFSVILSNNNKHYEAKQLSKLALKKIQYCLKQLELKSNELLVKMNSKFEIQSVNFEQVMIKQANSKIYELNRLLLAQDKDITANKLYEMIKKLFFWEKNKNNNYKFLRKQMGLPMKKEATRNLLGVFGADKWMKKISIGVVLSLGVKKFKWNHQHDIHTLLSHNQLLELALYISVSYFTISTQTRFKEVNQKMRKLNQSEKYMQMNTNSQIVQCKIYHLKAIEIALKFVPEAQTYIEHLIDSFNKNYKFYMQQILQAEQSIHKTHLNDKKYPSKYKQINLKNIVEQENRKYKQKQKQKHSKRINSCSKKQTSLGKQLSHQQKNQCKLKKIKSGVFF